MTEKLPEWVRDMQISDQLMRDIVNDGRRKGLPSMGGGGPVPADAGKVIDGNDRPAASTGTGWAESPSVNSWQAQAGIRDIDRLVDAADAQDKLQRLKVLAETVAALQALKVPK
jgi:hypothetical protein